MWGATLARPRPLQSGLFQSTHPCGVRPWVRPLRFGSLRFQSTHPCGVRPSSYVPLGLHYWFQSTHPCGVRPSYLNRQVKVTNFNPRTHVGCDEVTPKPAYTPPISIHAPMWGATKLSSFVWFSSEFQSTHPCGVRPTVSTLDGKVTQFQSTHPCGVRLL